MSAILVSLLLATNPEPAPAASEAAAPAPAVSEAAAVAPDERKNSVSIALPGLLWNGIGLVGERFVHPRVSLLVGLGGRFAGGGDYSAYTLSAGAGARIWLNYFQLFSDLGGPQLGVRLDGAWTRVAFRNITAPSMQLFSSVFSLRLGYRFVIKRRVEITPEGGLAVSMGFDRGPQLVVVPRPSLVLALTVGYLF